MTVEGPYGDDGELKKATFFPFTGMDAGAAQSWCAAGEQFLDLVEKGCEPGGEGGPVIGWAEGMLAEQ